MATITAKVLSGDAPSIQVVVPAGTVPRGTAFTVYGTTGSGGFTWQVRGGKGVSDGSQIVLTDPLAPINQPLSYLVGTPTGVVGTSQTVRRPWSGRDLLTDMLASARVAVIWQGGDARTVERRLALHTVSGRATPVPVMDTVMGAGEVSLTARTTLNDTTALLSLASTPKVLALLHNPAHCPWCRAGVCDIQPVTILALTEVSYTHSGRMDIPERLWDLKATVVGVPEPNKQIQSSSWTDFERLRWSWSFLASRRMSWDAFDATIWQEVGW